MQAVPKNERERGVIVLQLRLCELLEPGIVQDLWGGLGSACSRLVCGYSDVGLVLVSVSLATQGYGSQV
eukprot:480254-Prorocentrum_minimum.AAC.5